MTRRYYLLMVAVLLASSCGSQVGGGSKPVAPRAKHVSPLSAKLDADLLEASIINNMRTSAIDPIQTGFYTGPSAFGSPTHWLYVTVSDTTGAKGVQPYWEGLLLAGSYYQAASARGDSPESGVSIASQDEAAKGDTGEGSLLTGEVSDVTPTSDSTETIKARILARLQDLKLDPVSISFEQPDKYAAPVVIAQTSDPAGWVAAHQLGQSAVFGDSVYEGTYLEVDDVGGNPVTVDGFATRVRQGASWVRPDLDPFTSP